MDRQSRFLVHLPRPNGSADFLHIIKKSEATLQTAVDSMGPGDSGGKASVHLIGPEPDRGDPAGPGGPFDQAVPGDENIGRGATASRYKGHRHAVRIWRRDLDSSDQIAGSAVDDASMIGPRALKILRHTVKTLEDQLSVPGKLTKDQETILRSHIDSALETTHHVVLRARQESENNALQIDQNTPKKVELRDDLGPSNNARHVHIRDDLGPSNDGNIFRTQDGPILSTADNGTVSDVQQHSRMTTDTLSPGVGMPIQGPASGGQASGGGGGDSSAMSALMPLMQAISSLSQRLQQGDRQERHVIGDDGVPHRATSDLMGGLPAAM
ncbi:hypothetical protein [Nocardia amamiensis]|uniref:hypothetical protein n=1 Tax=Nocardia amamiensis TaxID=404578 RepID=UPI0033D0E1A6